MLTFMVAVVRIMSTAVLRSCLLLVILLVASRSDRVVVRSFSPRAQRRCCWSPTVVVVPPPLWKFRTRRSLVSPTMLPLTVRSNSKTPNDHRSDDNKNNRNGSNFLQDIFQSAFANDRDLLSQSNKRVGMLDEGTTSDDVFVVATKVPELTPTQQAWRQKMSSQQPQQQVLSTDLIDANIRMDLYLSGVPNKDPSNDLYASKTNISLRDRAVGQVLPTVPTIGNIQVRFLPNQKCEVSTTTTSSEKDNEDDDNNGSIVSSSSSESGSNFVNTNILGDWKLSEDGKQIRFRISVYGFQRTIQTKGTIQKIYWSNQQESVTQTSTLYSIPEGWLYFETELVKRSNGSIQWTTIPSSLAGGSSNIKNQRNPSALATNYGLIKVEQTTGFLGVASRMIPCGKFIVTTTSS